jgi:hypothetical protein
MAQTETDREDLLREATALVERVEWAIPGEKEPVVAGLRREGGVSVYFGSDPCYHFDAEGRLRRSFAEGCLYRSEGVALARLTRRREAGHVELLRSDLTSAEATRFLDQMRERVLSLVAAVRSGAAAVRGQVTQRGDLATDLAHRLERAAHEPCLAPALVRRSVK